MTLADEETLHAHRLLIYQLSLMELIWGTKWGNKFCKTYFWNQRSVTLLAVWRKALDSDLKDILHIKESSFQIKVCVVSHWCLNLFFCRPRIKFYTMLLILHFQRAEVDRHFGVCSNRTLSLSCTYTSGKFADETDIYMISLYDHFSLHHVVLF